jgi:hypothetical protein
MGSCQPKKLARYAWAKALIWCPETPLAVHSVTAADKYWQKVVERSYVQIARDSARYGKIHIQPNTIKQTKEKELKEPKK